MFCIVLGFGEYNRFRKTADIQLQRTAGTHLGCLHPRRSRRFEEKHSLFRRIHIDTSSNQPFLASGLHLQRHGTTSTPQIRHQLLETSAVGFQRHGATVLYPECGNRWQTTDGQHLHEPAEITRIRRYWRFTGETGIRSRIGYRLRTELIYFWKSWNPFSMKCLT